MPDPTPPADARALAVQAASAAGTVLVEHLGRVRQIRFKGEIDLVTEVDLESERLVVDLIRQRYPRHRILAEEGSVGGDDPDYRWIIDPLDGTTNYAHGFPFFCVSIALEVRGCVALGVVYDPVRDELFEAQIGGGATLNGQAIHVSATQDLAHALLTTGFPYDRALFPSAFRQFEALSLRSLAVRRLGSAVLDLCYVACGRFDAYWELFANPWDVAAGSLIVAEAGGLVSTVAGEPFDLGRGGVLASAPGVHAAIADALKAGAC